MLTLLADTDSAMDAYSKQARPTGVLLTHV